MKPQDFFLLILLVGFIWKNDKNWTTAAGIIFLILSIPLFSKHIFFTAQQLVYFAALYFLVAMIQVTIYKDKNKG